MRDANSTRNPVHLVTMAIAALALAGACGMAGAQPRGKGAYAGTIDVAGTQSGPEVKYKARVKVTLPISERKDSSVSAEFLAGEAPNGTVLLSQWDESFTQKSPDSDGRYSSYTCSLAAPVEVPVSVTGVLDVDLKAKKHAFSVTVLSLKDASLNCVSSRSGPYKRQLGLALTMGTGVPGEHYKTQLPFTDASRLAAKSTLVPGGDLKKTYGPIVQEWDLKLAP